jgi:integrase
MKECQQIFRVVDNPKHKLSRVIGYGAGLRVSEIVNLEWRDILFTEHKIHIKNAKGKKDGYGDASILYCGFSGLLQETVPTQSVCF